MDELLLGSNATGKAPSMIFTEEVKAEKQDNEEEQINPGTILLKRVAGFFAI